MKENLKISKPHIPKTFMPLTEAESSAFFSALVESSQDAIYTCDLNGQIGYCNHSTESLYGYSNEEFLGKAISSLFLPERLDDFTLVLQNVKEGNLVKEFESIHCRKDGSGIEISLTMSPVKNLTDTVIGASVIARDIGDRKKIDRELARSNYDLEQFAAVAAHDLQEPLRSIVGFLELFVDHQQNNLDETSLRYIDKVQSSAKRMQVLINDLLTYARIQTRSQEQKFFESALILEECEQNLGSLLTDVQGKITHDPLPKIWADPSQFAQLMQNLIGNALKFAQKDVPPAVHVSAQKEGTNWIFSISDNGIGIDNQYLERIFRLFERLHPRKNYPGTGIGLAVCKKIVERQGGKMWVKSEPNKGSKFCFTIPINRGE